MQVKPKGAAFVARALESVLRKFPAEASRMLDDGGVLRQVIRCPCPSKLSLAKQRPAILGPRLSRRVKCAQRYRHNGSM